MLRAWTLVSATLSLLLAIRSLPLFENEEGEIVTMELIGHHEDYRVRRAAGESDMPDVIVMKFSLAGDDVIMRLHRVPYLPVFLVGNASEQWHHTPMDSAVYADYTLLATFIVNRSESVDFLLTGNMKHRGRPISVNPKRFKHSAENEHVVSDFIFAGIDYGQDSIELPNLESDTNPEFRVAFKRKPVASVHTVETIFVIDYKDYSNWLKRYPTKTVRKLKEYYTYVAAQMNLIFSSVKEINRQIDVRVAVTGVYVFQNPKDSYSEDLNTHASGEPINATSFLEAFAKFIKGDTLPKSDHYMTFTGYRMKAELKSVVGIANRGKACSSYNSVSIVENSFDALVGSISAHELGHSLNAKHDKNAGCSDSQMNVMTSFTPPYIDNKVVNPKNIFDFSTCSVADITEYLERQICTLPAQTTAKLALPPLPDGPIIKDRDLQCQKVTGFNKSVRCTDQPEANLCSSMPCRMASGRCRYIIPFEGTPCGLRKVCHQGACKADKAVLRQ